MISYFIIPGFLLLIFVFAAIKKVDAYKLFLDGVKDGLKTSLSILPTMLAMYISINLLVASGLIDDLLNFKCIKVEILSQTIFRPFSSQASMSLMLEVFDKYGVDSNAGKLSSIIQGSSDSSVYIMSLYFGAYNIKKTKKSYIMGIIINIFSYLMAIFVYYVIKV